LFGRQQEMLALEQLAPELASHGRIMPVIEPSKTGDTMHRKLTTLRNAGGSAYVIVNPTRGDLRDPAARATALTLLAPDLADANHIRPTFREAEGQGLAELTAFLATYPAPRRIGVLLTTNLITPADLARALDRRDVVVFYGPTVNSMPYSATIALDRSIDVGDYFHVQEPNAAYTTVPDEFFANDLSNWKAPQRAGFSDYTLLGTTFKEGGGGAGAIAVHLSYMDGPNMRVRHFVSTTTTRGNDSRKWGEVLAAMEAEIAANPTKYEATTGLGEFRIQASTRVYTNLAKSKRQQLIHHLQTVARKMVRP
jgi:hypothetical protein